ncbi:cytochrome c1 [Paraglaciecola sp. MB-3u-78]|uniref:cytochrome c1 n=1 Tax=Paraglaciecola sp. MB-3u-78 TaxID=2058332 RepID=UPI000C32DD93|nr:cytochrome c1 [Paraglaciecola sp. MB-3u-78]PKH00279.1 cytochrome c1 [Paraglaciecola sp. MB-3u-78]
MKKIIFVLSLLLPMSVMAAGGNVHLDKAEYDLTDKASLQTGAQLFMNYCLGCHQTQYQRYQRTFDDLGIPLELGHENLQFTGEKPGEHIKNAMPSESGAKWFGAPPPDLTLVARVRGADWIYTYLRTFYADDSRPFGVNNLVFPEVGMPHVLQELQGLPSKTSEKMLVDGEMVDRDVGIKADGSGELSAAEYDKAVLDLVNYLVYVGEPSRLQSESIGRWVMIFLLVLLVLVYLLKKDYWRDVH